MSNGDDAGVWGFRRDALRDSSFDFGHPKHHSPLAHHNNKMNTPRGLKSSKHGCRVVCKFNQQVPDCADANATAPRRFGAGTPALTHSQIQSRKAPRMTSSIS